MNRIFLNTTDIKSENLIDFSYDAKFLNIELEIDDIVTEFKISYIDENSTSKKGVNFFIHGYPTWSYLWRHLLPFSIKAGHRTIAIDLPGFGRSDKPTFKEFFDFNNYRNTILSFINKLDLNKITLFMHEWGGTLGLTLPMERPDSFEGSVSFSSYLGNGLVPITESYKEWISKCKSTDDLNVRALMARTNRILNLAECNAYEAPFPDAKHKLALKMLPSIFPITDNDKGYEICIKAEEWWSSKKLKNSLVLGGGRDPLITVDKIKMISKLISSDGLTHVISNAGHFLPEWGMEYGDELFRQLDMSNNE